MSELIPAATVIPLRDVDDGSGGTELEVLMLRKNAALGFGGMWVFPGGRVDPGDEDPDAPGDELATARRAAAREALEEADLLVEPGGMVPFSHWTPPEVGGLHGSKRFATWFFACRAPVGDAGVVTIDGGEIHADEWVRPADMLRRRDAGEIELAPPTFVTLHDLAPHGDVESALDAAAARVPFRYATRIGDLDGALVTMWAGDAGYDTGDSARAGPRHRLVMSQPAWRFERDV